jgi:hypothetical protein
MKARRPYLESLEKRFCLDGAGIGLDDPVDPPVDSGTQPPSFPGDANCDGVFDSDDFVDVFQGGKYNSGHRASWHEGDWNEDGVFDPGDMVTAFIHGRYGLKPSDHDNGPPADVPRGNGPPADHDPPSQGDQAVVQVEGDQVEIMITSTKDLSNIVYRVTMPDGQYYDTKLDYLEGMTYTLQIEGLEEGAMVSDLWVKSGNNKSGDGPGYGQHFVWDGEAWVAADTTDSEETPPDGEPPCHEHPPTDRPPTDVPRGNGPPPDVPRGDGQPDDVPRGNGPPDDVPRGDGRPDGVPPCDLPPDDGGDGEMDPPSDPSATDAAIAEL